MAHQPSEAVGYDENFVEEPDADLFCPICLLVTRDPIQAQDCGHTICKSCHEQHRAKTKGPLKCLECNEERDAFFDDRKEKRRIDSLRVHCRKETCGWTGELRELQDHLQKFCALSSSNSTQMVSGEVRNHLQVTNDDGQVVSQQQLEDYLKMEVELVDLKCLKSELERENQQLKNEQEQRKQALEQRKKNNNDLKKEIVQLRRNHDKLDKDHALLKEQHQLGNEAYQKETSQLKRANEKLEKEHALLKEESTATIEENAKTILKLERKIEKLEKDYAQLKEKNRLAVNEQKRLAAELEVKNGHEESHATIKQLQLDKAKLVEEHDQEIRQLKLRVSHMSVSKREFELQTTIKQLHSDRAKLVEEHAEDLRKLNEAQMEVSKKEPQLNKMDGSVNLTFDDIREVGVKGNIDSSSGDSGCSLAMSSSGTATVEAVCDQSKITYDWVLQKGRWTKQAVKRRQPVKLAGGSDKVSEDTVHKSPEMTKLKARWDNTKPDYLGSFNGAFNNTPQQTGQYFSSPSDVGCCRLF